jgi:hypothetical protein
VIRRRHRLLIVFTVLAFAVGAVGVHAFVVQNGCHRPPKHAYWAMQRTGERTYERVVVHPYQGGYPCGREHLVEPTL